MASRRTAFITGALFLITFVTSIPAALYLYTRCWTAVLFDVIEPGSAAQVIATVPEFLWELSLGVYLLVKGFKPSSILSGAGSLSRDQPASTDAAT